MKHSYHISSGRVQLFPLAIEDIEKMRRLRNQNRHCFVFSGEITSDAQTRWYESYLSKENDYMFSVLYNGRWIGVVSIYDVDRVNAVAEFGRLLIDRNIAGIGGLGVDTTRAACEIAFSQLGINKIILEVYADNVAAQITYLKAGFVSTDMFEDDSGRKMLRMCLTR